MNIKQRLLGSMIGRFAISARDKLSILHTAYFYLERVGTLANEHLATRLVTTLCESRKTFIDVGAHIGAIITEVAYHDPSVKIVAVEAIPEKVVNLRATFPFVEFHDCAAGESTGEVSFFINNEQSGCSSLGIPANAREGLVSEIKTPLRRLDELVPSHDVDVIKIDVEGAELGVLRGSSNILDRSRPTIMFESGPQEYDGLGYSKEALYQFLVSNRYAVLMPNRVAHDDPGLTLDGFLEGHLYPQRTTNYFAIPKERRIEIRDKARRILNTPIA